MNEPRPLNPVLSDLAAAAFGSLGDFKNRLEQIPDDLVDLSVGDPAALPPDPVVAAVASHLADVSTYPVAAGIPALRGAVADWYRRRFEVEVDADSEVMPTIGSKEAIAHFQLVACGGDRDIVVVTEPGYNTPERSARFAGADVVRLPLDAASGWLPDLDAVPAAVWARTAVLWLNYPNNPTGAVAPLDFLDTAARLASHHGFWLAADEPYTEIWYGSPPPSATQVNDRSRVVAFTSLSKRSGLTGFRSGAMVAPAELVEATRLFRANFGLAPPRFVQDGAVAAWEDEDHVTALRAVYSRKHGTVVDALDAAGVALWGREATPYVWARGPEGIGSEAFALRCLAAGVAITPGNWFGAAGEGFVRIACVAPDPGCDRAAETLRRLWS
ncbi:MAG: aminotransferase class I/II-fold pyridoxal phosphate-dependent enzyme [Acidimicrobiia bacterium]|nr:aminotransferase class I/II-fold pyridoxal phosphate-dependent enzyme [Acidimicrobiia bacterium]